MWVGVIDLFSLSFVYTSKGSAPCGGVGVGDVPGNYRNHVLSYATVTIAILNSIA